MIEIATPPGMPTPWDQPDSTGWFEAKGKCGSTAVANTLELYGMKVSPAQAEADGVTWIVGARDVQIRDYLVSHQRGLGCSIQNPPDGPQFLREQLDAGHPVMLWFNTTGGFLQSHWVVVAGHQGQGDAEVAIVMSWGRYYKIAMKKLAIAWERVYFMRNPSVVCTATTKLIVR